MAIPITMENISEIGKIVRFHRNAAGLSRIDLADIAGVGKTVIYDIEHGKRTVQLNTLFHLLSALNIRISFEGPIMHQYESQKDEKD